MILHAHATRVNVGDDLLTFAVRRLVRLAAAEELPFLDFTNQSVPWEEERGEPLAPRLLDSGAGRLEIARAIARARAVVIGGGDLVANAPQYALLIRAAREAGVPVVALGIGVNLRGAPARVVELWRGALPSLHLVWAREEDSAARLVEFGVPRGNVTVLPDLAYSWEPRRRAERLDGLPDRYGVVSARSPEGNTERWDDAYLARLGRALEEASARHGMPWVFLPMVGTWQRGLGVERLDDHVAFEGIARHVPSGLAGFAFDRPIPPEEAESLLRGADVVVSMRLHAGILASLAGTPVVPISYSPKVAAWARSIGFEAVGPDAAGAAELAVRLDDLLARRDELRPRLLSAAAERRASILAALPALRAALDAPRGASRGEAEVARSLSFAPGLVDRARSAIRRLIPR